MYVVKESWTHALSSPPDCATLHIQIVGASVEQEKTLRLDSVDLDVADIVANADNKQSVPDHYCDDEYAQLVSQHLFYVWM
jgi:hypothetical protein